MIEIQVIHCPECGKEREVQPYERPHKSPDGSTIYWVVKCQCGEDLSDYVMR